MPWGRKFKSGLGLIAMWTIMLLADKLGEDAYVTLVGLTVGILYAANAATKFAQKS
jgi:hypothetical protein